MWNMVARGLFLVVLHPSSYKIHPNFIIENKLIGHGNKLSQIMDILV